MSDDRHPIFPGREGDFLAAYLAEVEQWSHVALPELRELLTKARAGDVEAKREVIQAYLLDAATIAMQSEPEWLDPLDKIQEANIVLFRLVDDHVVEDVREALKRRVPEVLRLIPPPR